MIEVKTADLIGPALDWAVGMAVDGMAIDCTGSVPRWKFPTLEVSVWAGDVELGDIERYSPSTDWSQGGPLIESNQVFLEPPHDAHRANYDEKTGKVRGCWQTCESWHATVSARVRTLPPKIEGLPGRVGRGEGETALIAACRSIVKSHFGDVISVPAELA